MKNPYINWQSFTAPALTWLAVVLVRSLASIRDTFDAVATSDFFGNVDHDGFEKLPLFKEPWTPKPDDSVASGQKVAPFLGMMLPEGIDLR